MKFLLAVLFFLGSSTAFAVADESVSDLSYHSAHGFEYYHGAGVYKKPSGKSADFLASLTIRDLGEGQHKFSYGIYSSRGSMHYNIVISDRADTSFFDVMSQGETIGYGYCMGSKCHLEYSLEGYDIEDTIKRHKRGGALTCTGSKRGEHGIIKSWKMSLKKIF